LVELLKLRTFNSLDQEKPGCRQHGEEKAGDDA
jgi:hypothetical protein